MLGVRDRVGDQTSPAVCRSGQGDGAVMVAAHRAVADRVDAIRAGAAMFINKDVASAGLDARGLGKGGVGADSS